MDKRWTRVGPPTLHDLEWLPNGQGLDPPKSDWTPQPFTTWRVLLSRKLTASVTKFCLYNVPLHQGVGRSQGSLISPAPGKGLHSPNVFQNHNSRQHSLTESPLFLPAPARNLTESPNTESPLLLPAPRQRQTRRTPTCSAACFCTIPASPLLFPAPARTASQKAHMRTCQHGLTESPIQTGTDSQKANMQCRLFLHTIPATASSGICQDSLTESRHKNPPAQTH